MRKIHLIHLKGGSYSFYSRSWQTSKIVHSNLYTSYNGESKHTKESDHVP
jgi:hypothetical protein